jgi:hypothetical protein
VRTPHRVRTLVRLTEDQHAWLYRLGEFWEAEGVDPGRYTRHDGGVNVSQVIRDLLGRASYDLPAAAADPWPADERSLSPFPD